MPDKASTQYFDLTAAEQAEILQSLAPVMGRRAEILEKDIWLCQVLGLLFTLPSRKPMAFKGGTSLSKVYKAIERFSEDIDVTVDYRSLIHNAPDLESLTSNTQRSKLSNALKEALAQHVHSELVPELKTALSNAIHSQQVIIEVSADAEKLWVYYPSAVENEDEYLRPCILIEFGGRNSTLPKSVEKITADIASHLPEIALPTAEVSVLSATRTFWEKATLIHVECHRANPRLDAGRLSRHWYDLVRLADSEIGRQAIQDIELLRDVLRIKETFYRSSFSRYDLCLSGELMLVPDMPLLEALRKDYRAMLAAQMFYGSVIEFDQIEDRLRSLETEINKRIGGNN